jgi:hypothetical protein
MALKSVEGKIFEQKSPSEISDQYIVILHK